MTLTALFQIAGGLALFLLAMEMMTNGLKQYAGHQLKHILGHWTRTPLRGVASGMLITGIVQHSGAVTVATIGFVNAGLMTLVQALAVVFGANVGTTMTGWLVSLVGFGVNIEAFALPILALGVGMRLVASNHRRRSLGEAISGFALFFLGLSILKTTVDGFTSGVSGESLLDPDHGLLAYLLIGFLVTVVTQSSSAALAIVLTAAAGGLVTLDNAAAAVIGANLGSTSTAAISVLKATSSARRLAVGHILFNLVTGAIALMLLPLMLLSVDLITKWLELETNAAVSLALFHTLFNVLGVALMLPLTVPLARMLEKLFRSPEEDSARPRYLDNTLVDTPELALEASSRELVRLSSMVGGLMRTALDRENLKTTDMTARADTARTLYVEITDYISRVRTSGMAPDIVDSLSLSVRISRYLNEVLSLLSDILKVRSLQRQLGGNGLEKPLQDYLGLLRQLTEEDCPVEELAKTAKRDYHHLKSSVLRMMVQGTIPTAAGEQLLDTLSNLRRLTQQWAKAKSGLRDMAGKEGPDHS